ncbi:YggT family protein [Alicyclobacillus fastidiosus]|uniref:YggT family protein n=1 Tax=Alicyclobacillus fastidiosus TaxID=392011 RepID=A0ABV5AH38_9BACL|nr:YggT family protein [Alicyclobacillus fastidiosus]WEH08105.1 YggT family protein [Alicyclobacillus fastidiosus]
MSALTTIVQGLFSAYWYVLLATAVVGLVPDLRETQVGQLLSRVTDPYLNIYRRVVRPLVVGQITLDLSWMIGVAVFFVIEEAVGSVMTRLLMNV